MSKKLQKIIVIMIVLAFIVVGVILGYKEYKIQSAGLSKYYESLARQCGLESFFLEITDCCFSSVIEMSKHNYKAPGQKGCPKNSDPNSQLGLYKGRLTCPGSMEWCFFSED